MLGIIQISRENCPFADLMHGRRICRSFWEYFKVTHVIPEAPAAYDPLATGAAPFAPTGEVKESSYSLIRHALTICSDNRITFTITRPK